MARAVTHRASGAKVPVGGNRSRAFKSPIDKAKGYEVSWQAVAPLFEAARPITNATFVYFIGEADNGHIKIGLSKDPIGRLRTMQTGNPRRLRVEQVVVGDMHIEKLLHELWLKHAVRSARQTSERFPGTEWFTPDVRDTLLPCIATASQLQAAYLKSADTPTMGALEAAIRQAHGAHDITAARPDVPRYIGDGSNDAPATRI